MRFEVKNASFSYKNDRKIFEDVNFSVDSGDIVAILGPNGAGKTTLLKCILGILKLESGEALLDGKDVRRMPERELFKRVSYVPQAKNTTAAYTVRDTVLIGLAAELSVFKSPGEAEEERARAVLRELNIEHLIDKKCNKISGGELQMVLIARALISEPEVLILDEPESNLDFRNQLIVLDTLTKLSKRGIACIFNTHYPSHALQRANKAIILSEGHTVCGDCESTITAEAIEKAFNVKATINEYSDGENTIKTVVPISVIR
ncbi:MAG: ABC transporter ATP-binding protein [Lachnospiraceae bacterium]|nr:ABC transporter ATP-binding protein [Lachnospiraceae bacterium]